MDIKKLYEKYIYRFASCFFITTAAAIIINSFTGYLLDNLLIVFFVLLFSASSVLFDILARKLVFYITLGAALTAIFVFVAVFEISIFETVNTAFVWLLYESKDNGVFEYALISLTILEAAFSLILFTLMRFRHIRLAAGAGLAVAVLVLAFFEYNADKLSVFFIFAYIFAVSLELVLKNSEHRRGVAYLFPFVLTAGIITVVLPSSQTPIQWNAVKSLIENVQAFAYKIGDNFALIFSSDSFEFNLNMTGFSESGKILGELVSSDNHALTVRRSVNSGKSLYLTGTVMDKYTGKGWERADTYNYENSGLNEYELDLLETLAALYRSGLLNDDELYKARDIEIFYNGLRTRSLFYPLKTLNINTVLKYEAENGSIFINGISDKNTSYRLKYLDIDYGNEKITELLRNSVFEIELLNEINVKGIKQKINAASSLKIPAGYEKISEERRENIYEKYTRLPDTVRSEVYELSLEITAGCDNVYDKLLVLESFLAGYNYTLSPPALTDEELTYQLLFETGEGYCTYFATAFAVMARTLGVPTRFVQGYLTNFDEKTENNLYIIRNKNAHAWAEAYIDGIGWIPFEPTPGFAAARYPEWEKKKISADFDPSVVYPNYEQPVSDLQPPPETEQTGGSNNGVILSILIIFGVASVSITAAVTFTVFISIRKKNKKLNINGIENYYLDNFKEIMLFLKTFGYEPEKGETLNCFFEKLDNEKLAEITPIYQKVRYGSITPSQEELEILLKYREELAEAVKKRIGKIRYFMLVYK